MISARGKRTVTVNRGDKTYAVEFQNGEPQSIASIYRNFKNFGSSRRTFWTRHQSSKSALADSLIAEAQSMTPSALRSQNRSSQGEA